VGLTVIFLSPCWISTLPCKPSKESWAMIFPIATGSVSSPISSLIRPAIRPRVIRT